MGKGWLVDVFMIEGFVVMNVLILGWYLVGELFVMCGID